MLPCGGEGLLSCEDLVRRLRRPDPVPQPQKAGAFCVCNFIQCDVAQRLRESKSYDLAQKQGLADFLKDADIRLVHTPGCSVESAKACSHPILPVVRENQHV